MQKRDALRLSADRKAFFRVVADARELEGFAENLVEGGG